MLEVLLRRSSSLVQAVVTALMASQNCEFKGLGAVGFSLSSLLAEPTPRVFAQNRVDTSQLTQVCAYEPIPSSHTDICIRKFGGNAQNVAPRVNSLNSLETLAPSA